MNAESITERPTLRDVAAAANVSIATASRALSGKGGSSATTLAVLEASTRLNYRPDPAARSLRAQETGLVGMIVPGVSNPFFAELVEAVENALQSAGVELVLSDSRNSSEQQLARVRTLNDRRADGLIIVPTAFGQTAELGRELARMRNVVQIDREIGGFAADFVGIDNHVGIRLVLEHLAARGARRIAFVSGDRDTSTGGGRLEAFESGIARFAGLAVADVLLGEFSVAWGEEAARGILAGGERPDAIVCGSDVIAIGVLRVLRAGGVRVPDDVRVTGFDGISFSELSDPPLTTVAQPFTAIAEEAVRLLQLRLAGAGGAIQRSTISPTLIVRGSA